MNFYIKLLSTLMAGIALSFIQAPYDLWLLIFPCFGLFYYLYASAENKKQAFLFSFIFALGYFIAGLNWIGNALLVEGNEYKWVWPLAVIALPTLLSLFTALYITINYILFKHNALLKFIGFCLFLSLSEWIRGYAFTGFPWNLYGYGPASNPAISQSLSVIGPYGLTLLTIIWGSVSGYFFAKSPYRIVISILVVLTFAGSYFYGYDRLKKADVSFNDDVEIHIIQPNITQSEKWKSEKLAYNFERHVSALQTPLAPNKKHVVIWPETAIPPVLLGSPALRERLDNMIGDNAVLLSGALTVEQKTASQPPEYNNALLLFSKKDGIKNLYSKSHLVPFGEYIPFQKYIPLPTITQFSGFKRGGGPETVSLSGYPSFSPLICYEVIFPNESISGNASRPDYMLTITNDGWYGDSAGPHQHFAQSRFRAIEQGIPLLRSANTGVSGVIDPYGRIIQKLELSEYGSIDTFLPQKLLNPTLYGRYGDSIFLIFTLLGLLSALIFSRKRSRS